MKKIASLLLLVLVATTGLIQANPVQAQSPAPATATATPEAVVPPAETVNPENVIPFTKIGLAQDKTMRGPYDGMFLSFPLPSNWQPTTGGMLKLDIQTDFAYKGVSPTPQPESAWGSTYGGMVSVFLNGVLLTDINVIGGGSRTVTAMLPAAAVKPNQTTGQNDLYISFDASDTCYYDWTSTVTIKTTSTFTFPHNIVPVSTSLIPFPRPIFQTGSMEAQSVILVVPDAPSAEEMQATLAVAGGLGKLTVNKLGINLVTSSALTGELRNNNHIIFIGKPASLPGNRPVSFTGASRSQRL